MYQLDISSSENWNILLDKEKHAFYVRQKNFYPMMSFSWKLPYLTMIFHLAFEKVLVTLSFFHYSPIYCSKSYSRLDTAWEWQHPWMRLHKFTWLHTWKACAWHQDKGGKGFPFRNFVPVCAIPVRISPLTSPSFLEKKSVIAI